MMKIIFLIFFSLQANATSIFGSASQSSNSTPFDNTINGFISDNAQYAVESISKIEPKEKILTDAVLSYFRNKLQSFLKIDLT